MRHPQHHHHYHHLKEAGEDEGGGGGQQQHPQQCGRGPVQDRPRSVTHGILDSLLARVCSWQQVGGTHVGREVDGEADTHDQVDHGDGGQGEPPVEEQAEDASEDHEDGEDDQRHHEGMRQEEEGDHGHNAHGTPHQQHSGREYRQELFESHKRRVVGQHRQRPAVGQLTHTFHKAGQGVLLPGAFWQHEAAWSQHFPPVLAHHHVLLEVGRSWEETVQVLHKLSRMGRVVEGRVEIWSEPASLELTLNLGVVTSHGQQAQQLLTVTAGVVHLAVHDEPDGNPGRKVLVDHSQVPMQVGRLRHQVLQHQALRQVQHAVAGRHQVADKDQDDDETHGRLGEDGGQEEAGPALTETLIGTVVVGGSSPTAHSRAGGPALTQQLLTGPGHAARQPVSWRIHATAVQCQAAGEEGEVGQVTEQHRHTWLSSNTVMHDHDHDQSDG